MTELQTLQALQAKLCPLVEARKVKCLKCKGDGFLWAVSGPKEVQPRCADCKGTGQKLNPKFQGLREVLVEECPCILSEDLRWGYLPYEEHPVTCKACYLRGKHSDKCFCAGTGYVPRNWEDREIYPKGALAGALTKAYADFCMATGLRGHPICLQGVDWCREDVDEEATKAVIEKMEKLDTKKEGT